MDALTPILIAKALDGLSARSVATASNIANANSPGYRPLRVDFEDSLRAAAAAGGERAVSAVSPRTVEVPGVAGEARLDLELVTAAQTSMRYAALIDVLGREMAISRAVLAGGR